jgi:small basic protein (TIGR04137 family)
MKNSGMGFMRGGKIDSGRFNTHHAGKPIMDRCARSKRYEPSAKPLFLKKPLPPVGRPDNLGAPTVQPAFPMSKHNSLKSAATVGGKRSVLKRFERVKLLKERGEWKQGKSPIGLPKTKHEA